MGWLSSWRRSLDQCNATTQPRSSLHRSGLIKILLHSLLHSTNCTNFLQNSQWIKKKSPNVFTFLYIIQYLYFPHNLENRLHRKIMLRPVNNTSESITMSSQATFTLTQWPWTSLDICGSCMWEHKCPAQLDLIFLMVFTLQALWYKVCVRSDWASARKEKVIVLWMHSQWVSPCPASCTLYPGSNFT